MQKIVSLILAGSLMAMAGCAGKSSVEEFTPTEYVEHTVTFPANEIGRTEYSDHIFEIDPFDVAFSLPAGWELTTDEVSTSSPGKDSFLQSGIWSCVYISSPDHGYVGALGYNIISPEEASYLTSRPEAIYSDIAIGNGYHFGVYEFYEPVGEDESVAITEVYYSESYLSAYTNDSEEIVNKGILAYSADHMVYVAFEFRDDVLNQEQLLNVANSISFSKEQTEG